MFIAKIVFNIVTGRDRGRSQFEEQLRLVEAINLEEAYLKARAIGIGEEEELFREGQPSVKWQFVDVTDLVPLPSLKTGSEIYSQIHETEESLEYIHHTHQRGMALRLNVNQSN
jgi:hypothetical protein